GFIAVAINYRLGWNNGGIAKAHCLGDTASLIQAVYRGMQDANAALRYLISKANDYGIDTNWIFIGGASAGGAVALTSSYITDGYAQINFAIQAAKLGELQNADNSLTNSYSIK